MVFWNEEKFYINYIRLSVRMINEVREYVEIRWYE